MSKKMSLRESCSLRKPTYIRTDIHTKCRAKLEESNVVLITGDVGSGKTALAKRLFEERKGISKNCFQIQNPEELTYVTRGITILFDDIFGKHVEDVLLTLSWYKTMRNLELRSKKVTLILTSRSDIFFRCKDRKGLTFLKEHEIDISSMKLPREEVEGVFKQYGFPSPTEEIVGTLGLFQKCELWTVLRNMSSIDMDLNVTKESFNELFLNLETKRKDQYFAILITLVFGNQFCDEDFEKLNFCEVAKFIGCFKDKETLQKSTQSALHSLSDSILLNKERKYCISNSVIYDAACKHFITHHPLVFIKYSELTVLDALSAHFDCISDDQVKELCKRLSTGVEILTEKKLYNTLKNVRTLGEFLVILSENENDLNTFLNSDFFWFTCWSNNMVSTEMLLRRMKDRRHIIESALSCCSDSCCDLLKRYLNTASSGATAIPPSPTIYDEMQGPFSKCLTLEALECTVSDFPRLRYHNKLMVGLGDRFVPLQREIPELKIIDFIHWKQTCENPVIYLAGKDPDKSYLFVAKGKRIKSKIATKDQRQKRRTFAKFMERSPSCILYTCDDRQPKEDVIASIRKLSRDVASSDLTSLGFCVIVILKHEKYTLPSMELRDMSECGVQIVTSSGDNELMEHLTSAFEVMMIEYIKLFQLTLCSENLKYSKKLCSLKKESDAVFNRLQLASRLPNFRKEIPLSMSVPTLIQSVLDSNADKIYGYGFRPNEFYLMIDEKVPTNKKEALRREISKSKEKSGFPWEIKFEESKGVNITKHFGSGTPLVPDKTKPENFGTLGGFAQINSKEVVGLTNFHVIGNNIVAFVKDGEKIIKLGKSKLVLVPGEKSLADVALIQVDNGLVEKCEKLLVDDDNKPQSAKIYLGTPEQIVPAIVHKKGASTGITRGIVVEVMNYREILGERETQSAFLVEDTEEPFSAPGDSGSLVFQISLSACQTDIEVVAIINGRYKKHSEKEDSPYILCSNMKHVYETLDGRGEKLHFFRKEDL